MSAIEPGPVDHVGIAVSDLDGAVERYRELLGAAVVHRERVESQGVEVVFLEIAGSTRIELLSPLGDETPVGRFLERRGPGLHHVCYRVDDLEAALESLDAAGARLVDRRPRRGAAGSRIAFVHPEAFDGVLVELKQR